MIAIREGAKRVIRVGDNLVQAATGPVEHVLTKTIRGIEYTFEICCPCDIWTAQKIVRKIK